MLVILKVGMERTRNARTEECNANHELQYPLALWRCLSHFFCHIVVLFVCGHRKMVEVVSFKRFVGSSVRVELLRGTFRSMFEYFSSSCLILSPPWKNVLLFDALRCVLGD